MPEYFLKKTSLEGDTRNPFLNKIHHHMLVCHKMAIRGQRVAGVNMVVKTDKPIQLNLEVCMWTTRGLYHLKWILESVSSCSLIDITLTYSMPGILKLGLLSKSSI
jgi:hypothetical protein